MCVFGKGGVGLWWWWWWWRVCVESLVCVGRRLRLRLRWKGNILGVWLIVGDMGEWGDGLMVLDVGCWMLGNFHTRLMVLEDGMWGRKGKECVIAWVWNCGRWMHFSQLINGNMLTVGYLIVDLGYPGVHIDVCLCDWCIVSANSLEFMTTSIKIGVRDEYGDNCVNHKEWLIYCSRLQYRICTLRASDCTKWCVC